MGLVALNRIAALGRTTRRTRSISPSTYDGLVAWWKADALSLADAASVTSWADENDGHTLLKPLEAGAPKFYGGVKNGLPVVRFASSNSDTLAQSTGYSSPDHALLNAWRKKGFAALFVVCKPNFGATKGELIYIETGSGSGRCGFAASETNYQGIFTAFGRRLDDDSANFTPGTGEGGAITPNEWYIVSALTEWANAKQMVRVNGVKVGENLSFQTAGNTSDTESGYFAIGTNIGSAYFDGDIGEVITYNAQITETQAAQIESYLNRRWGVY